MKKRFIVIMIQLAGRRGREPDAARPNRSLRRPVASCVASGAAVFFALGIGGAAAQGTGASGPATGLPGTFNPITPLLPPRPPRVGPEAPAAPIAPTPLAGNATHQVARLEVSGSTAYPSGDLAGLTAGLVGAATPEQRIEAARAAIVSRYRDDGYLYTTVNAVLDGSTLRFVVTEGRIADIKLDGDIGPAATQVLRFLNHLTDERPLRQASLERWLLLSSDVPGVTIRSELVPTDTPGDLLLVGHLSRRPVTGLVSADNRAFRQSGPQEGLAVVDFNSFSEYGERSEVSVYNTFTGADVFGQASFETFLGGSGLKLRIYGGAGIAYPTGNLRAIGYEGITRVFGGALSYPVLRERQQTLIVSGLFDAIESDISNTLGPGFSRQRASFDSLRVLRASADYTRFDILLGSAHPATDSIIVRLSQGLSALGATANDNPTPGRQNGRVNFFKANGQISRLQTLASFPGERSLALQETVLGQVTPDVLPSEEEYFLGGPHYNRGYYFGQVTGDNALISSAELQFNTPLPVPGFLLAQMPSWISLGELTSQFYAFYDYGRTWQNQNVDPNRTLNSTGGGARLFLTSHLEVDLEGDLRIDRYPNGTGGPRLPGSAFYWNVTARF